MKKNYLLLKSLLLLSALNMQAQKSEKYDPQSAFQKTMKMEANVSKADALKEFGKKYGLDERSTFQIHTETSDYSGLTHQRHQQYFNGLKVEFGTVITHTKNGQVESVNGELYNPAELDLKPTLTPAQGFEIALNAVNAQKYLWEDDATAKIMEYNKPKGELVVFPVINKNQITLAYKYDIYASLPISREEIYVDANSGEILYKNPLIKHASRLISGSEIRKQSNQFEQMIAGSVTTLAVGTAATRYSGSRSIETTFDAGLSKYVLNDLTRSGGVVTYNCNRGGYSDTHFQDNDNSWTAAEFNNTNKDNAGLDAHWGAEMTFDFWKNIFNRNSFDDKGSKIKSYVNADLPTINPTNTSNDNAFWNGSVMTYGSGSSLDALTAIDVCGHEIGHAVCTYTANLAYQNQSGAMNEGFSDIWGACIEQYGRTGNLNAPADTASPGTQGIWKIGEDLGPNLRSMSYPNSKGDPDTFLGTNYRDTQNDTGILPACSSPTRTNDYCGVHTNSGVLNHWFYILTAGKSGTNNASAANGGPDVYNVTGIGMAKSSQIAYYAERDYLTPNSTFADARNATIAVASSLYCATSAEVQAVTNAWYAVNIGNAFTAPANDIALKSISGGNIDVSCGASYNPSIVIENGGTATLSTATITYNVDGGANSVINWTGNLANCSQAVQAIPVSGLTRGFHLVNVTVTTTGDGNAVNNTKSLVVVANDNGTVGTVNTFNAASDILVSIDSNGKTNSVWERGTVNKTRLTAAATGSSAGYATKLVGNYPDKTTAYLVSQCYNLSNITNPTVSFDMAFDLESNWDIIYFEYSTDSGANWNVLGTSTDANWYNSSRLPNGTDCFNCIGKQWTGDYATAPSGGTGVNGNKRNYSHSLTSLGSPSNAIFRFTFVSDDAANQEGIFVDNFVVQGTLGTNGNSFEQFVVYPNPSNGKFNVALSTSDKVDIGIYDLRGRSVYNKSFESNGAVFNKEIDLNSLSSGVYILNVSSGSKKEARRIIIE